MPGLGIGTKRATKRGLVFMRGAAESIAATSMSFSPYGPFPPADTPEGTELADFFSNGSGSEVWSVNDPNLSFDRNTLKIAPGGSFSSAEVTVDVTVLVADVSYVQTVTLAVAEQAAYTVVNASELADALIYHQNSGSQAAVLLLRDGDYDPSLANWNRDFTGKPLTIYGESSDGVRMLNGEMLISSGKHITFDRINFHRTRDYIENVGNPNMITAGTGTEFITIKNCRQSGDVIPEADIVRPYPPAYVGGYPCPTGFDFSRAGTGIVIENFRSQYMSSFGTFPLTDGTVLRNVTGTELYSDFLRMTGNANSRDTDVIIVEGMRFNRIFGFYNEAGTQTPHPDIFQLYDLSGTLEPTEGGTLIVRDFMGMPGATRSAASTVQGMLDQAKYLKAVVLDRVALLVTGSHGISPHTTNRLRDQLIVNSTIANWNGDGQAELRYTATDGIIRTFESVFSGSINENIPADPTPTTIINIGSVFSSADTDFTGTLTPNDFAEMASALVGGTGTAIEGLGAFGADGNLKARLPIPVAAGAPTVVVEELGITITPSVPTDLDGGIVDYYEAIVRGNNGVATVVSPVSLTGTLFIGTAKNATVWTYPVMVGGLPGLLSDPTSFTVPDLPANLISNTTALNANTIVTDNGDGTYDLTRTGSSGTLQAYVSISNIGGPQVLTLNGAIIKTANTPSGKSVFALQGPNNNGSGGAALPGNGTSTTSGSDGDPIISFIDETFSATGSPDHFIIITVPSLLATQGIRLELSVDL